jgi:hypothetical protein
MYYHWKGWKKWKENKTEVEHKVEPGMRLTNIIFWNPRPGGKWAVFYVKLSNSQEKQIWSIHVVLKKKQQTQNIP